MNKSKSALKKIDDLIDNFAKDQIEILYRPHPKQHPRQCEYNFNRDFYANVYLDPETANRNSQNGLYPPMNYYVKLINEVDGIITPFSTMMIEAALCGKPSLVICFPDGIHEWKFDNAAKSEHLSALKKFEWVIFCLKKNELDVKFKQFLKIINTPGIDEKIKKDINHIVYSDKLTYSQRLLNLVNQFFFQQKVGLQHFKPS